MNTSLGYFDMGYLYRCGGNYKSGAMKGQPCRQRHHFKKKVEEYARDKICPNCKNKIVYRDKWQEKKNEETKCYCDQVAGEHGPFPHRSGSYVWCINHPTGPTEQDYKDRHGGYE